MTDWLMMGGHGPYVWSAYGIFLGMVFYNIVIPIRRHRQSLERIHRAIRRKEKLDQ